MKIGFIGAALGHPITYTNAVRELRLAEISGIWPDSHEQEKGEKFSKSLDIPFYSSCEELIAKSDALVITTETYKHKEYGLKVLGQGKPVFVDKPMATNYADAVAIIDKAKSANIPVMSCSMYRFAPSFVTIATAVRAGKIGKPISATMFVPHGVRPGDWQDRVETSGGLIFNFGIHCVDVLVSAFGQKAEEVNAFAGKLAHPHVDSHDTAVIQIRFADGSVATAEVIGSMRTGEKMATAPILRVFGTGNSLQARLDENQVYEYAGQRFDVSPYHFQNIGAHDTMKAFVNMAKSGEPVIPYDEMLWTIQILDAARQSATTSRRVCID